MCQSFPCEPGDYIVIIVAQFLVVPKLKVDGANAPLSTPPYKGVSFRRLGHLGHIREGLRLRL